MINITAPEKHWHIMRSVEAEVWPWLDNIMIGCFLSITAICLLYWAQKFLLYQGRPSALESLVGPPSAQRLRHVYV